MVVARVTSMVTLISNGRSRAIAACQARRPKPGTSQMASIGIAAPIAMLTEAAARAINCDAAAGKTCVLTMADSQTPRALAISTCGAAKTE